MNQNNGSQSEEGKYHGAPLHSIFSFLFVSLFSMTFLDVVLFLLIFCSKDPPRHYSEHSFLTMLKALACKYNNSVGVSYLKLLDIPSIRNKVM